MIEENSSKGKTRGLFKTIRDITGTFTPRIGIVKNKQGKVKEIKLKQGGRNTLRIYIGVIQQYLKSF